MRMRSGVSTGPGHSALTRTPWRANCTASSRLIERTAPLDEKRSAASRPIPPAAPVMTATFPASLSTLEKPLALVIRHDPVEKHLLGAGEVEVMIDHIVAERGSRHAAVFQGRDRVTERVRESLHVGFVRVALELRRQLQALLDSAEAGRQQRREAQVRIDVRAGDA